MTMRVPCLVFLFAMAIVFSLALVAPSGATAGSAKSGKSGKSSKSGKSGKSGKSRKSAKSGKSGKSGKSCKGRRCDDTAPPVPTCEPGQLPNVTVEVTTAGTLRILGDACGNNLTIRRGMAAGELSISVPLGFGLNGVPGPSSLNVAGLTDAVLVDLGSGDDRIEVAGVDLPGDLHLDLGSGNNWVRFFDLDVAGSSSITAGDGNDVFGGPSIRIVGDMVFDYGGGTNVIGLDLRAGRDLLISTGDGNDSVSLVDASGADGDVWIDVGNGNNTISFRDSGAVQNLSVLAGDGNDVLQILRMRPGGGRVSARLGDGDDMFSVFDSTVGSLHADGGAGSDSLDTTGSTVGLPQVILGFELIVP